MGRNGPCQPDKSCPQTTGYMVKFGHLQILIVKKHNVLKTSPTAGLITSTKIGAIETENRQSPLDDGHIIEDRGKIGPKNPVGIPHASDDFFYSDVLCSSNHKFCKSI